MFLGSCRTNFCIFMDTWAQYQLNFKIVFQQEPRFHVPLHISISCKLPKGGDTNAWQDMATKRAQILKDYLVDSGFPADKVQVSGAVGANEMQILLLDSSIFPPKPPAKNARGASKSPR